eukprot:5099711-Pyramimonas_sp.AAC.1
MGASTLSVRSEVRAPEQIHAHGAMQRAGHRTAQQSLQPRTTGLSALKQRSHTWLAHSLRRAEFRRRSSVSLLRSSTRSG